MRERSALREHEARRRSAHQERSDYELAVALSRSLAEEQSERPGDAAAAAGAAALRRAQHTPPGARAGQAQSRLPPLQMQQRPHPHAQAQRAPLAAVSRAVTGSYTDAFNEAVEERFNAWSTSMYTSNTYLQEIGATARQEQRDRIREQLEREWLAARLPVYETSAGPRRPMHDPGQRLGGGSGKWPRGLVGD